MVHRKNSLAFLCEEKGLSWNTFKNRYYDYGWTLERALNEPPFTRLRSLQDRRKKLFADYKQRSLSYKQMAEKYKMSIDVLHSTIRDIKRKEIK